MTGNTHESTRKMAVIAPAAFLASIGIGLSCLGFLFIVKERFGASASVVGGFTATWSVMYFVGCVTLKPLWSRIRPRISMIWMLVTCACAFGSFLAFPSLVAAFIAYGIFGIASSLFWPPLMGWLSRALEGRNLSRATNLFNFSWSFGGIISPFLAGVFSERDKLLPVLASIVVFLANAVFIAISMVILKDESETARPMSVGAAAAEDRSTPLRRPAWLGIFLAYAVMGVVFNIFPVFARDVLALPESRIGLILTVRAIASAAGFALLGRFHALQGNSRIIPALSLGMLAVLLCLLFIKAELGYTVAFFALGLLLSAIYNNSLFYATSGAADRDRRVTVHEALLTAGQVLGSVAGGFLYQFWSLPVVFAALALALAAGSVLQAAMIRAHPPFLTNASL